MDDCSYNYLMEYEWDETKRASNIKKRGVDFVDAEGFDWETALVAYDGWYDDEDRWIAIGYIGITVYLMVYTERDEIIRIISLRKATPNEGKHYVQNN